MPRKPKGFKKQKKIRKSQKIIKNQDKDCKEVTDRFNAVFRQKVC